MIGIFVSGGLIFLCGVFGKLVFRKDAMGFGDVKLMGMIGGFLGWKIAVATFFLALFLGYCWPAQAYLKKSQCDSLRSVFVTGSFYIFI